MIIPISRLRDEDRAAILRDDGRRAIPLSVPEAPNNSDDDQGSEGASSDRTVRPEGDTTPVLGPSKPSRLNRKYPNLKSAKRKRRHSSSQAKGPRDGSQANPEASPRLRNRPSHKDAIYEGKLHELRHKRRWNYEERQCLMNHLSRFHWLDQMNHLDILHTIRKHKINYNSSQGRPWAIDVELFMSGRRIRTDVTNEIEMLRRKNNSITGEMQQNGWCKSTIQLLRDALHVPGLHLAMLLGPPAAGTSQRRDHSNCSDTKCNVLQVNDREYKAAHLCQGGNCANVTVDTSSVHGIIQDSRDGRLPRAALPLTDTVPLKLGVVDQGPYIAISHVYSHRMGNSDNTMPLCQLHRLQRFLKELQGASSDTQLFWMDTFCVPAARQYGDSRRKAISSISKIFSNADKILVLDATLLETSCKDASPVELSIRILSSDWMRRLWTLEEAMLARDDSRKEKLVFRFRDGAVTLQKLIADLQRESCPYARSAMFALRKHLTLRVLPDFRAWRPEVDSDASRFAQLAKAVEYRSTSKPGDEMLCMASILGLDSQQIVSVEALDEKMIEFYLKLRQLPISLLFCNGKRIRKAPFRWAVGSLLTSENPSKLDPLSRATDRLGHCDQDGLHVQCAGVLFKIDPRPQLTFNRLSIWLPLEKLILEPTRWELAYNASAAHDQSREDALAQSWGRVQEASRTDTLVLLTNLSNEHEGVVLRLTTKQKDRQGHHVEFLCQVHVGRQRLRRLADVGYIPRQKVATSGYFRHGVREDEEENVRTPRREPDKGFTPWRRRGTGDFFRGMPTATNMSKGADDRVDDDSLRNDMATPRIYRRAVEVEQAMKEQRWLIT